MNCEGGLHGDKASEQCAFGLAVSRGEGRPRTKRRNPGESVPLEGDACAAAICCYGQERKYGTPPSPKTRPCARFRPSHTLTRGGWAGQHKWRDLLCRSAGKSFLLPFQLRATRSDAVGIDGGLMENSQNFCRHELQFTQFRRSLKRVKLCFAYFRTTRYRRHHRSR